jgi:hypothetical protein
MRWPRNHSKLLHEPLRPFGTHAYAVSPAGARKLLAAPQWCTVIQGTNGAPAPFPCVNNPYRESFTCPGALPQGVGCVASAPNRSGGVAPAGYVTYVGDNSGAIKSE